MLLSPPKKTWRLCFYCEMLVSLKPTVTACWHWQNVKSDFLSDGVWWRWEFCSFYDKKWKLCTPSDSKRRAQYFNGRCRVNGTVICPLRGAVFNSMLIFLSSRQRWNNLITNHIKNLQSCSSYIITLFTQVVLIPELLAWQISKWANLGLAGPAPRSRVSLWDRPLKIDLTRG